MNYRQNYKAKLELEKAAMIADGLVSERYSGVSSIEFHLTYFQRGLAPVLMQRTLSFLPANYASFHMKCFQDGCTDGGYDLAPVVKAMVKARKTSATGRIACQGTNFSSAHASIGYEVSIRYTKQADLRSDRVSRGLPRG